MMRTWKITGAILLLGGTLLVASPDVRANVITFFGWHSVHSQVTAIGGSSAQFQRETPGTMEAQKFTQSLAEARAFLGHGVTLPSSLEGSELFLYREVDKEGKLLLVGLSDPNKGFWARYRPANDYLVKASYGADFNVELSERIIKGRPARVVKLNRTDSTKKAEAELWIHDGNWVYELRDPMGDVEALVTLAESME